jgi:4-carboxymuconolactone decarboxylase
MRWPPACRRTSSMALPTPTPRVCRIPTDLREILSKTLAWQLIPDALQAQATAEWGKDGLVEIVVVSGFYQMFAAINQGFDIASLK